MKIIQKKVNQKQTKIKNKNKKDIKSNNNSLNKRKIAKVNNYVSKTAKIGKNVKICWNGKKQEHVQQHDKHEQRGKNTKQQKHTATQHDKKKRQQVHCQQTTCKNTKSHKSFTTKTLRRKEKISVNYS